MYKLNTKSKNSGAENIFSIAHVSTGIDIPFSIVSNVSILRLRLLAWISSCVRSVSTMVMFSISCIVDWDWDTSAASIEQ